MDLVPVALAALAALLPITDPLGALAAYAGPTGGTDPVDVRRQAIRTAAYVFAILAVLALLGSLVPSALGITLGSLQIAGGLVVAHSGFGMITARETATDAEKAHAATKQDVSSSPMALPLVAGPGRSAS